MPTFKTADLCIVNNVQPVKHHLLLKEMIKIKNSKGIVLQKVREQGIRFWDERSKFTM